jgi:hypothetical protein
MIVVRIMGRGQNALGQNNEKKGVEGSELKIIILIMLVILTPSESLSSE